MKRIVWNSLVIAALAAPFVVAACGPEPEAKGPALVSSVSAAPTPSPSPVASPAPSPEPPTPPPPPAPVVEEMAASDDPKPLPTAKITAPANDAAIDPAKAKDFEVKLDVKNWTTAEGDQHVHLILDDHPYKPIYDHKKPVKLSELLPAGAELTPGFHVLTAFPSRKTHESVKGKGASSQVVFWVGKKGKTLFDAKKPHVIYSRPKGANLGPMGAELMVDFYLTNTLLDKGEKVRCTIRGPKLVTPVVFEFTKWAPKVVKNLQAGDYDVQLELLDKNGSPFEGPLTATTRTNVKVDPAGTPEPHHPTAAPSASGK